MSNVFDQFDAPRPRRLLTDEQLFGAMQRPKQTMTFEEALALPSSDTQRPKRLLSDDELGLPGITVKLNDGRRITVQTDDPKKALEAVEKFLANEAAPSSGVTIAPKGGVAREATPEEARQIDFAGASFADVGSAALANFVPSAKRFGEDILRIVTDPVGTGTALKNVTFGAVEKLIPGRQSHEQYAEEVGNFFAERYGGWENLKRTMAEDPVGFAADAAAILTGGQLALARAPGVAGQVARAAGRAASAIDPISNTVRAAKTAGRGVGHIAASLGGVTTGTGGQVLREAARSGYRGGQAGQAFREHMRGTASMEDVITDAQTALAAIKRDRAAAYRAGMGSVKADTKILSFREIERSLAKTKADYSFKGVSKSPVASKALQRVALILDDWKKLDPTEFRTAEGFDALKQRVGAVLETIPFEQRAARKAVGQVYNTVKSQIVKQAPAYAKTMEGYSQASNLIQEIERTLSLNPRANIDTKLRKLQSVMRNNVNTTYGRRGDLVKLLEEHGAQHLMAKLAGQAANQWSARGLARAVQGLQGVGGVGAAFATLNPATLLPLIPTLAMQSPRLVSEAVHAGGRLTGLGQNIPFSRALQGGYLTREQLPSSPSLASHLLRQ